MHSNCQQRHLSPQLHIECDVGIIGTMDIIGIIGIILGNELQAYYDFISDASYAESVIVYYRMYQHRKYMYDLSF